jgi:hypothetical protein
MRRVGLIVATVVATLDVVYIGFIAFVQGGTSDQPWRVPFVASYLGVLALCAILSATVSQESWRLAFAGASAGGLLVLGFLALFSIGLPLVVMGLVTAVALVRVITSASRRGIAAGASIAGVLASVLVLFAGIWITERIIACPPRAVSGSGSGFLSGSYSYTCQNGRAIVRYGN